MAAKLSYGLALDTDCTNTRKNAEKRVITASWYVFDATKSRIHRGAIRIENPPALIKVSTVLLSR